MYVCIIVQVEKKKIEVQHFGSTEQHSGIFTKPLPIGMFNVERDVLLIKRNL